MFTLMRGKDTKKKTDKAEVVERVADEIPSELGGELSIFLPGCLEIIQV
eukprot:SAG11_NODE_95_length_17051_cov_3.557102_14_plen_49_part_00